MDKLQETIIIFIGAGEVERHKITSKIKNYSKLERYIAIRGLINKEFILFKEKTNNLRGRNPIVVSLTKKGLLAYSDLTSELDYSNPWKSARSL